MNIKIQNALHCFSSGKSSLGSGKSCKQTSVRCFVSDVVIIHSKLTLKARRMKSKSTLN